MSGKVRKQSKKNRLLEDDHSGYFVVGDLENESFRPNRTQTHGSNMGRSEKGISVKSRQQSRSLNDWQIAIFRDQLDYEDRDTWYLQ